MASQYSNHPFSGTCMLVSGFFLIRFNFKKTPYHKTLFAPSWWEPLQTYAHPKTSTAANKASTSQGIIVIITYNHQGAPVLFRRCFLTAVILSDHGSQGTGCSSQSWRRLRSCKSFENSALLSAFWTILVFFHGEKCSETASCRKPLTCPWYPPGTQLVHFFGHQEYLLYHLRNSMVYPPLSLLKPQTFRISRWYHLTPVTIEKKCHERVSSSWWFRPVWKTLLKLDHFPK